MNDTTPSAIQSESASPDVAPAFVFDCGGLASSACQGESFFREHEGKRYCVLHYPGADKVEAFRVAFNRKLEAKDFDFVGVWFPEEISFEGFEFSTDANFHKATFSADADFNNARFSANADFSFVKLNEQADFYDVMFSADADFSFVKLNADANFHGTTFSAAANFDRTMFSAAANFYSTTFSSAANFDRMTVNADANYWDAKFSEDAYFSEATFSANALFYRATFNADALFYRATFRASSDFNNATFKNYVRFARGKGERSFGEAHQLDFQFTHIEKPDRVSFHTLDLKPHWFINCDCRKFEFVDCEWNHNLKQELESATKAEINTPHRLLAITFRQLADNAEANHRYHEASNFRYNAFEARRVEKFSGLVPWRLDWWYWLASGYGERVGRAFVVFIALFALFAFGYTWTGFDQSGKAATASVPQATNQPDTIGKPLDWQDAFIYSFYVTILQKPKPEPLTRTAKILVGLETVLGPAQAALLALAVRRRFMR